MTSVPLAESAFGLERNLSFQGVLRRNTAADILASATAATANPEGVAILWNPLGSLLIGIIQLGSTAPTGLCYITSADLGQTWSAATQISSRQDVYPAAVINEAAGDVHLVYAKRGYPGLSVAWSIWYRVLAWTGAAWSIGGENTIIAGGAAHGYSQVSLGVDANGFMVSTFQDNVNNVETFFEAAYSNAPWDFTTFTINIQLSGILPVSINIFSIVRYLPEIGYWFILYQTNGTVRLLTSTGVLSSGSHSLTWAQVATFFVSAGEQYALAWQPTPLGAAFGQVGIAYQNGSNISWRTFEPQSSTLSAATQLNTNNGAYPAVTRISAYWFIGWFETVSGDTNRLRLVRSDALTTFFELDSDPGADGWGWLRFPEDLSGVKTLPLMWSDTQDPGIDGYNVYAGMVSVEVLITVQAFATAVDSVLSGPQVSDTGTADDSALSAGEQLTVNDTGTAVDVPGLNPVSFDTGHVAETFAFRVGPASENEFGVATETFTIVATLTVADTGHAAAVAGVGLQKQIADSGAIAELLGRIGSEIERAFAHETFGIGILVQEQAGAAEQVLGGPDISDAATAVDEPGIGIAVRETGAALDSIMPEPTILDSSIISEVLNAGQISSQTPHYGILAIAGQHVGSFSGIAGGWSARAIAADDVGQRIYVYEDIDTGYTDIVFTTQPLDQTTYTKLKRSIDGGNTFNSVGPQMMAYIAHGPDGTLWGVGNDGTQPASPVPPPYGLPDGTNFYGWALTCRQVFKSTDKGATWGKVFDDQTYGQFGRYPHYTQIAVDDGGRPLAIGVARGAVTDQEIQIARHGGIDPSGWQTLLIPKALMTARSAPSGALGARVGDSFLAAAGSGRFVFGGNFASQQLLPGPDRIWTSDDYGSSWDLRFSDQLPGFDQAAPCDCTFRGGVLYAVRSDGLNLAPGKRILVSINNGQSWSFVSEPTLPVAAGSYSAVGYDSKTGTLYVGTAEAQGPIWRMDGAPVGTWESIVFNLAQASNDQQLRVSYGGIGIASGLILHFNVFVNDSGHANETAGQQRLAHDRATIVETLTVTLDTGVTLKLFMHRGRVRLRMLGNIEQAVITNPEG